MLPRIAIVLSLTATLLTTSLAADVKALAAAVDAHYNHLYSLQAEFTELYRGSGMERTESGTLWLKKPGKMRWEYRSPKDKLFVSNGKDAWFYVPDDRQARKTAAKKLEDVRSPLAFMLGKTKLVVSSFSRLPTPSPTGLTPYPVPEPCSPRSSPPPLPQSTAASNAPGLASLTSQPPKNTSKSHPTRASAL